MNIFLVYVGDSLMECRSFRGSSTFFILRNNPNVGMFTRKIFLLYRQLASKGQQEKELIFPKTVPSTIIYKSSQ
jgi:hypothetical protein